MKIFSVLFWGITSLSIWRLFVLAKQPGWPALVPFWNVIVLARMVGVGSNEIFLFVGAGLLGSLKWAGKWTPAALSLGAISPVAGLVALYYGFHIMEKVSERYQRPKSFAWGLILLPVVFFPILAFTSTEPAEK